MKENKKLTKVIRWTKDDRDRADALAYLYNGSTSEVLRAGIRALEREHKRALRLTKG